ncbi:hypothetical protein M2432_003744 [Mycobacterium sp. OTB74]|nr:hypothetical protein [Mycobacterium sp. OTB74]
MVCFGRNRHAAHAEGMQVAFDSDRLVIFINVVGCGTEPSGYIRQNRRQESKPAASRHSDS